MKFQYLHDPLLKPLYEDDDIIAIDKPYGIDSHTNESKTGNEGFVVPGLIELFESNLGRRLHIIHRLDRTTTGVIVFGKSLESAKKYQRYFRNRESEKTYLFVTAARGSRTECETGEPIFHKGAELEAKTSFKRMKSESGFELWQARPHTGRNHQIRIHGAHVGLPLLGDGKYGGESFPFLCLHNRVLKFPGGVEIESRAPEYFQNLSLLKDQNLSCLFHELDRRQRLFASGFEPGGLGEEGSGRDCVRLLHQSDAVMDLFAQDAVLTWYKDIWARSDESAFKALATALNRPIRARLAGASLRDKSGKPQERILLPDSDRRETDGEARDSSGIFADQRLQRRWVRNNAERKAVLNLFAGTGAYGIAALRGGASEVTCVETSKAGLGLAKKNFEAGGWKSETAQFLNRESLVFLDQCRAKERRFDLIICDAPAFVRGDRRHFKIDVDLESILRGALEILNPGGALLFSTSAPSLLADDIRVTILSAQAKLRIENLSITRLQSALDCELPGERSGLKSFLIARPAGPFVSSEFNTH